MQGLTRVVFGLALAETAKKCQSKAAEAERQDTVFDNLGTAGRASITESAAAQCPLLKELLHRLRCGRISGMVGNAKQVHYKPQRALMLI